MLQKDSRKSWFTVPKLTIYLTIIFLLSSAVLIKLYRREVRKVKRLNSLHEQYLSMYEKNTEKMPLTYGGLILPKSLQKVPFADDQGIVLSVKDVNIRGVLAPYNASILSFQDHYRLFFRYDVMQTKKIAPFFTYIGCCELDQEFNQTESPFVTIDTKSTFSEDPRVIESNGRVFVIYNDLLLRRESGGIISQFFLEKQDIKTPRMMHIAELDENLETKSVTNLDVQLKWVEKNWTPFVYGAKGEQKHVFFEYNRNPHKILKLEDPSVNKIQHMSYLDHPPFQNLYWPKEWGDLRGGTPALKMDKDYLAFFHSSIIEDDGFVWYVMGAYTFEDKPPFRITSVSRYPLLYKGIFSTPHQNTAPLTVRSIYPSGFVIKKQGNTEVIHLSVGENDSAIKIITLDKEKLLNSLRKI